MAAGPVTILDLDSTPAALNDWQLLKSPSIVQTAVTAAKLSQNLLDVSFAESTVEAVDVSIFTGIRFQVWGVANNDDAPVVDLYGWSATGPGQHIGQVTLAYGNFTSAATTGFHAATTTHSSIRDAYTAATAYRGCDTYTETTDYESAITVYTEEADFPAGGVVSFTNSQYKYLSMLVTTLAGTTLGAIFRPLGLKSRLVSPDGM